MIQVLEQGRTFHLITAHTSMILHAMPSGHLMSLYWGSRVEGDSFSYIVRDMKRPVICAEQTESMISGWNNIRCCTRPGESGFENAGCSVLL